MPLSVFGPDELLIRQENNDTEKVGWRGKTTQQQYVGPWFFQDLYGFGEIMDATTSVGARRGD